MVGENESYGLLIEKGRLMLQHVDVVDNITKIDTLLDIKVDNYKQLIDCVYKIQTRRK